MVTSYVQPSVHWPIAESCKTRVPHDTLDKARSQWRFMTLFVAEGRLWAQLPQPWITHRPTHLPTCWQVRAWGWRFSCPGLIRRTCDPLATYAMQVVSQESLPQLYSSWGQAEGSWPDRELNPPRSNRSALHMQCTCSVGCTPQNAVWAVPLIMVSECSTTELVWLSLK